MKSWLKVVLIVLIGLVLVALTLLGRIYWWGKPKPEATVVLTLPPTPAKALTVEGLNPPAVKPEWKAKMLAYEKRAQWLDTPTWVSETIDTPKGKKQIQFYQLPLISTGEWGRVVLRLRNGQQFQADVLYTLELNVLREVVVVPLVMGVEHQGAYLALPHFATPWEYPSGIGRDAFLKTARQKWHLGALVIVTADPPLANVLGFQWQQCNLGGYAAMGLPKWVCALGQGIEQEWPGYTMLVLRRMLYPPSALPEDFVLFGAFPSDVPDKEVNFWEVQR